MRSFRTSKLALQNAALSAYIHIHRAEKDWLNEIWSARGTQRKVRSHSWEFDKENFLSLAREKTQRNFQKMFVFFLFSFLLKLINFHVYYLILSMFREWHAEKATFFSGACVEVNEFCFCCCRFQTFSFCFSVPPDAVARLSMLLMASFAQVSDCGVKNDYVTKHLFSSHRWFSAFGLCKLCVTGTRRRWRFLSDQCCSVAWRHCARFRSNLWEKITSLVLGAGETKTNNPIAIWLITCCSYFEFRAVCDVKLSPKRYIFALSPHGVYPYGFFLFGTVMEKLLFDASKM